LCRSDRTSRASWGMRRRVPEPKRHNNWFSSRIKIFTSRPDDQFPSAHEATITICPCDKCGVPATELTRVKAIIHENPRSLVPAVLVIAIVCTCLGIVAFLAWNVLPAFGKSYVDPKINVPAQVVLIAIILLMRRCIPLKALICTKCRRV